MNKNNALVCWMGLALCAPTVAQDVGAELSNQFDVYHLGGNLAEYDAYGLNGGADWAVGSRSRVQLAGAYAHSVDSLGTFNTRFARAGAEWQAAVTTALEGEYRNDNGKVETGLLRLRGEVRGDLGVIGLALARRRINIEFDVGPNLRPFVDTEQHTYSTEYGARLRWSGDPVALYASGSYYDYDVDLDRLGARLDGSRIPPALRAELLRRLDAIRFELGRVTLRSLRLARTMLDYTGTVGMDVRVGAHTLNAEYFREREAITEQTVQGGEVGWIIPVGDAADVEIRAGGARFEDSPTTYYGGVMLSFYR